MSSKDLHKYALRRSPSALVRLSVGTCALTLAACEPELEIGRWAPQVAIPDATPVGPNEPEPEPGMEPPDPAPPAMEDPTEPSPEPQPDDAGPPPESDDLDAGSGDASESEQTECRPELPDGGSASDDARLADWKGPLELPWSTSFEDGFCAYSDAQGYCYAAPDAYYQLVTSPVRSGQFAVAFGTTSDTTLDGIQARCVRRGTLPLSAYYGAWYFIPESARNTGNWNLFHFQGAGEGQELHGLWDVSLGNMPDGGLHLYMLDFMNGGTRERPEPLAVPTGAWFHIEVFLRRAADATGEVALYQDGELLFRVTDIVTDDSEWAQWYVGNWTDRLNPPDSMLYVDDITIREGP